MYEEATFDEVEKVQLAAAQLFIKGEWKSDRMQIQGATARKKHTASHTKSNIKFRKPTERKDATLCFRTLCQLQPNARSLDSHTVSL